MKLFLILLAISLQVSAAALSQEITLSVKKAPFREVMQNLRIQTGYQFILQSSVLEEAKPVTITLHKISIEDALKKIFEDQPLTYSISNKVVIIKKKETVTNLPQDPVSDPIIIKGKVTDRNNKPLPGVNIRIKGRDIGTTTDVNGNYTLKMDAPGTLLFTYIGFRSYEKKITAPTELNINLEDISAQLDQVQIIAYGTTTKRFTTSNISTVKGEDLAKQPITNLLLGLQGRAPGVFLTQTSGVPGADVKTRVQGENSLRNGNEAFYVIDGMPYTPQNLYSGISIGTYPSPGSTLSFINPADIESIEILKDADATAIYGSRAANGAILITTKKGKPGKTKIDLNMQSGWGKTTKRIKLLNTEQYLEIRNEALKNANRTPGPRDFDVNGIWDQTKYTDWQNELLGNTSHYTNLQGSISGGNDGTQFLAGGGLIRETTVFPGDFSDTKANVHLSINHASQNKKFQFSLSTNYLQDLNKLPTSDLTGVAIILPPNAPNLYNDDGTINWQPKPNEPNSVTFTNNPAASLLRRYRTKTSNIFGNALIGYKIGENVTLKTTLGYNKLNTDEISTNPQTSFLPTDTRNNRTASFGYKNIASWIIEPQITFNKDFNFGGINALLGTSFQATDKSVDAYEASNFSNDTQLENIKAAGNITPSINVMKSEYRYNAVFGRLNYILRNKYIINLSARRDGSSRFGSENLFNSFYSIAGAWLFGDEEWFPKLKSAISFGKIRVTYGTTGNDQIQDYQFLNLYNNNTSNITIPYQQSVGLLPTGLSNPYLQWEETRKLNIGLDLGFLNNKILLNINYYRNRSSNQLLEYGLPYMTGFSSILKNVPALVQNYGWEISSEITPLTKKNFIWQTSFNLTIPRNKLISYPGLEESSFKDIYEVGKSTNIIKLYEFAGINEESGLYQFKTAEGKLTSAPNYLIDRTQMVTLGPTLYGGLTNTLSFKEFQLSFLLQFVQQTSQNYKFGSPFPGFNTNQPIDILSRWTTMNNNTDMQKVSTSSDIINPFSIAKTSNAGYSNASFVRLKNISVSYSLSPNILNKIKISGARLYVQSQNLLTLTKFKWNDPEAGLPGVLPPLRVISTGIQLTF